MEIDTQKTLEKSLLERQRENDRALLSKKISFTEWDKENQKIIEQKRGDHDRKNGLFMRNIKLS